MNNRSSKILIAFIAFIALLFLANVLYKEFFVNVSPSPDFPRAPEADVATDGLPQERTEGKEPTPRAPETILENLTIPWDIVFISPRQLLAAERAGNIVLFDLDTKESKTISLEGVSHRGEGGLLGITLHPDFNKNNFVYIYKTSSVDGNSFNSVLRYQLKDFMLAEEKVVLENIPGARFHNGGRIEFGPDGHLYIATGDATHEELAQDTNSLAGKILRVDELGGIPADNPFGNAVYSLGHRNPQGLAWDDNERLWSTEHGRSGALSGLDELNLIEKGANYGWPESQGNSVMAGTVGPVIHSGASTTWAPASAAYLDGSIYFGGLRGEALFEAVLGNGDVTELREHHHKDFGRIRTVRVGPDNMLYITTSNRDGRGDPLSNDDRIIRIDPRSLK